MLLQHGHAKARIEGKDIFTGKKYIDISPTSHTMYAPVVETETWMVLDINDGFFSLMNEETSETNDDLPLPPAESEDPELASKIETSWEECSESGRDMYVIVTTAPTSDTAKEAHSQVTGFKTGTE